MRVMQWAFTPSSPITIIDRGRHFLIYSKININDDLFLDSPFACVVSIIG